MTSPKGARVHPVTGEYNDHKGTDFSAATGTPIHAVAAGTILVSKMDPDGYGNYVVIDHGSYYTLYAHMVAPGTNTGVNVPAGAVIGRVGSTGSSTGPHLHFEIREGGQDFWSSTTRDPMDYLDSDGGDIIGTVIPTTPLPNSANIEEYSSSDITYESSVIPRTILQSSTQPLMPFVEIYVADQQLTFTPPQYVISLDYHRIQDGAGDTLDLVIFDRDWESIEELFSQNFDNIKIRYGYANGVSSQTYLVELTDYTINFNPAGTMLSIKGVSIGTVANLKPVTLNTKTVNPTEAAKEICRAVGWTVIDSNFHPSEDISMRDSANISLIEEYPATYILNHLAPLAIRKSDGESGYTFYLDSTKEPPVAHFKPLDYREASQRTYVYMRGLDSPIIDFSLTVSGVFGGTGLNSVTTEISSTFIDPITKEIHTVSNNIEASRITATGEYTHTKSDQSKAIVDAAGSSKSHMDAILKYKLKNSEVLPYEGLLTLVGDPTFIVGETIRLIVLTNKGHLHHSSGLYLVQEITDTISGGTLQTALKIFKRENVESGIQIVNYRKLLK